MYKPILTNFLIVLSIGIFLFSSCKDELNSVLVPTKNRVQVDSLYATVASIIDLNPSQALEIGKSMLNQAEAISYQEGIAKAHRIVGTAFDYTAKYDSAIKHYSLDLQIRQEMEDEVGMAKAYNNIAIVHKIVGLNKESISYYKSALAILQKAEDRKEIAKVEYNLGRVYEESKLFPEAEQCYETSLALFKQINDTLHIGQVTNDLGLLKEIRFASKKATHQDYTQLLEFYVASLGLHREIGYPNSVAYANINVARIYNRLKRPGDALPYAIEAKKILSTTSDKANLLIALNELAEAMYLLNDPTKSLAYLKQSESLNQTLEVPAYEAANDMFALFQLVLQRTGNTILVSGYKEKQLQTQSAQRLMKERAKLQRLEYQVMVSKFNSDLSALTAVKERRKRSFFEVTTFCLIFGFLIIGYFYIQNNGKLREYREFSKIMLGR